MVYYVYRDSHNQWRWKLKASNGRIIADSAEAYRNRQDCLNGIALVRRSSNAAIVDV